MSHPWMPFNVDDYLADTGHLTTLEHGAYLLLIMHYWREGGLPSDERMIARVARLTASQWAESRDVLAGFFKDGWRHNRIDEELAKASEIIEKRRAAATAGHARRKSTASAEQMQDGCTDTRVPPLPEPSTSSLRSDDAASASVVADPRKLLFDQGLPMLSAMCGKPEGKLRGLVGGWLRDCDDDAVRVLTLISAAHRDRPAEPIAWITKRTQSRAPPQNGQSRQFTNAERALHALDQYREPSERQFPDPESRIGATLEASYVRRAG